MGGRALERLARQRRGGLRRPDLFPGRYFRGRRDREIAGGGRRALRTSRETSVIIRRDDEFLMLHRAVDDYWHVVGGSRTARPSPKPPRASCARRPAWTRRSSTFGCRRPTACLKRCATNISRESTRSRSRTSQCGCPQVGNPCSTKSTTTTAG